MANPALEQAIINKIRDKGIALPVLPDVALRARRVIDDPEMDRATVIDLCLKALSTDDEQEKETYLKQVLNTVGYNRDAG